VHVSVIDHKAWDRTVLGEAPRALASRRLTEQRAAEIARNLGTVDDRPDVSREENLLSVAEIRRRTSDRKAAQSDQARRFYLQGQDAEAKGQLGVAKIFYRMAEKRADASLKREISLRLAALEKRRDELAAAR
jgi:hypothetical protein